MDFTICAFELLAICALAWQPLPNAARVYIQKSKRFYQIYAGSPIIQLYCKFQGSVMKKEMKKILLVEFNLNF